MSKLFEMFEHGGVVLSPESLLVLERYNSPCRRWVRRVGVWVYGLASLGLRAGLAAVAAEIEKEEE